jgi:hypothetical protein
MTVGNKRNEIQRHGRSVGEKDGFRTVIGQQDVWSSGPERQKKAKKESLVGAGQIRPSNRPRGFSDPVVPVYLNEDFCSSARATHGLCSTYNAETYGCEIVLTCLIRQNCMWGS